MARITFFAAIDIGSSQMSMKIFQIDKNSGITVIEHCASNIAIGKETYNYGKISYELTGEICSCIESFKRIMKEYGVTEYICYATSAVREASNSEYIRDQIFIRTGLKVGIASNEEERFLHHKALALNMKNFDSIIKEGAIIVDVSAGSLQVSSYENSELKFSQNLPLGSLRIMELMSGVNNNTIRFLKLLKDHTLNMLSLYSNSFFTNIMYRSVIFIGSQSEKIKAALGIKGDEVKAEQIEKLYNEIMETGLDEFGEKYDFGYDECRQIMASVILYRSFLKDNKKIYMPDVEFTDGICVEYVEKNKFTHTKHSFTNDIISSAVYYARRYNMNMGHVNKTVLYCTEIFNALSKKFGLSKSDLLLLKVAAIYANTGLYININDYNIYSYNIKKSNKLLGLSTRDNDIIAFVVLFQNGIFENEEYKYLPKSRKLQISKLSSILSLALALDYEYKQKIDSIKATLKNDEMIITADSDEDITMEMWQFEESEKFFREVFGIHAELKKKL